MSAAQGAAGGGGLFGILGTLKQGQAAAASGDYNKSIYDYNASLTEQSGAQQVEKQQKSAAKTIGAARAQYSASGIDTGQGSALDVIQSSAAQAALDSSMIQYNANAKAYGLRNSGILEKYKGDEARDASYYAASGQLLSTVGSLFAMGG